MPYIDPSLYVEDLDLLGVLISGGEWPEVLDGEYGSDEITSTGGSAFAQVSNLTTVELPNVTTLGWESFRSCTDLASVSFPLITSIPNNQFKGCSALTSISIPEATSIGSYAFNNCSSLTSISFPEVTSIGSNAFENCSSLTAVSLPLVQTFAGGYIFRGCTSLKNGSFPECTNVYANSFRESSFESVSMPKLTQMSYYAFAYCGSLVNISFPLLTELPESAFNNCRALTEITGTQFPLLTTVGTKAFQWCQALKTVSLPEVTSIRNDAFDWTAVETLNLPKMTSLGRFGAPTTTLKEIHFASATTGVDLQSCTNLIVLDLPSITSAPNFSFRGLAKLTTVDISSLEILSHCLFQNCTALTTITAPEATETQNSFIGCTALEKAVFPKVTSCWGSEFSNCPSLNTLDFGSLCSLSECLKSTTTPALTSLILRTTEGVCTGIVDVSAIPTGLKVYVPSALVADYQTEYSGVTFRALESYTVDGTITGELDPDKI